MVLRSPPRKVTYFEPVPPRLARNAIIGSTFEVGRRFRCTMRVDCGQLDHGAVIWPVPGEWQPHMPAPRLDEEELADWRDGRDTVYQLAALTIGAPRGRRLRATPKPVEPSVSDPAPSAERPARKPRVLAILSPAPARNEELAAPVHPDSPTTRQIPRSLTASRTDEALGAQWGEFALGEALWIVPPPRMKTRVSIACRYRSPQWRSSLGKPPFGIAISCFQGSRKAGR